MDNSLHSPMKVLPYSPKSSKLRGEFSIEFKKDCTLYFAASTVFVKKGSKVVVVERERLGK